MNKEDKKVDKVNKVNKVKNKLRIFRLVDVDPKTVAKNELLRKILERSRSF